MKTTLYPTLRRTLCLCLLGVAFATNTRAEFVYVTSTVSNCVNAVDCPNSLNLDVNVNTGLVYNENALGFFTSAIAQAPGKPGSTGARAFSQIFSNTTPDMGITISPTLSVTGGVYKLYHVFSSAAGNVSANILLAATNVDGCTLSFSNGITKFQSSFGVSSGGMHVWQFIGYVTNNVDTSTPTINFYFEGGDVDAATSKRLLVDTFLFVDDPCSAVAQVGITGAYKVGDTTVTVTGVDAAATAVKVYQYENGTWTQVGIKNSGITAGNNSVTVSGLVKGGQLAATQTLGGQEGCLWGIPTGIVVGTPNPRIRLALSLRETPSTGPVGSPGVTTGGATGNIHFLGVTNRLTAAPGFPGAVIYPSNNVWQTVTFNAGIQFVGDVTNTTGVAEANAGYIANDSVTLRVYAYRTVPENGVLIYSQTPAQSLAVTSNDVFSVNWSWSAVTGADGYRLLRDVNAGGYNDYVDVAAATVFSDANNAWVSGNTVLPNRTQTGPAVKWNTAAGDPHPANTQYSIRSNWYTIDAFAFAIDDLTSTGPHDIYLDSIQNGSTTFYNMEPAPAGINDAYAFRAPGFSGTTSTLLAGSPNAAVTANSVAYEGTKSMRFQWAWNSTANSRWLRLTTSGVGNPQVNVLEPITIRFLYVPDGGTMPPPPPAPVISVTKIGVHTVFNWAGGHRLQSCETNVAGVYTNVPQGASTYANIVAGGFLGPWTNAPLEPERYFRLRD